MRRGWPAAWRPAAASLVLALLAGTAVAPCAYACSCVEPEPLARVVDARTAVVVGRVGPPIELGRYPFVVERWFTGPTPAAVLTVRSGEIAQQDGSIMYDTCGRSYEAGQHLVLVGSQSAGELETSICTLGAPIDSEQGQALVAEAERLFGPGLTPDPTTDPAAPAARTEPGPGLLPVVLVAGSGVALAALALAAVVLLRRRPEGPG